MRPQPLPSHHLTESPIVLGHVANMIAMRIHDDISIGLFESQEHVHHLYLPLYHQARVGQEGGGGVSFLENSIWIIWDMDWGEEVVLRRGGCSKSIGY
jgi:hypothetical protein